MKYSYEYPRPAVTSDTVIFGYNQKTNSLCLLLIKRKNEPFKHKWALPGGFLDENETLEHCALRELKEETGLENIILEELKAFSKPGRDPRGHTVSVVYFGLVSTLDHQPKAGDDAEHLEWIPLLNIKDLAFDHDEIISFAAKKLYEKLKFNTIDYLFVPKGFSLIHLNNIATILSDYQIKKHTAF